MIVPTPASSPMEPPKAIRLLVRAVSFNENPFDRHKWRDHVALGHMRSPAMAASVWPGIPAFDIPAHRAKNSE